METKKFRVNSKHADEVIYVYQAFGYQVFCTEKKKHKTTITMARNQFTPWLYRLKKLEKSYNKLKRHLIYWCWIPLIGFLAGIAGMVYYYMFSSNIYYFALCLVAALIFFAITMASFTKTLSNRACFISERTKLTEEGYKLQGIKRAIPKDQFIRKDGVHYHYLYNHFKNVL